MASPQAEAFHAQVRAFREAAIGNPDAPIPTLEQMRAGSIASMEMVGVMPPGVEVSSSAQGNEHWLTVTPEGVNDADGVLLYLHGGAYVINNPNTHVRLGAGLAKAAHCTGWILDYVKAPEHPFPSAINEVVEFYRWMVEHGHRPDRIVFAGDSAGGGLAVAAMLAIRDAGLPQPAGAALLSPWTDLQATGESVSTNAANDLMVDPYAMGMFAAMYLAGADASHPLASPIHADLRGLAPMAIQVGGHEALLDDSSRLAVRAAHAGCSVRLEVFPEMQHVFQTALGMLPEADEAVASLGAWIRARLTT